MANIENDYLEINYCTCFSIKAKKHLDGKFNNRRL